MVYWLVTWTIIFNLSVACPKVDTTPMKDVYGRGMVEPYRDTTKDNEICTEKKKVAKSIIFKTEEEAKSFVEAGEESDLFYNYHPYLLNCDDIVLKDSSRTVLGCKLADFKIRMMPTRELSKQEIQKSETAYKWAKWFLEVESPIRK